MKNEEFKKQMKKIRPSDELIEKTIENIKNVNKVKKGNKVKKLIAGTAAALTLSVGSVGAYIAVTGNTQILEKIGINLSQKYEENEQIITEENSVVSKFSAEGIEAILKSAAIDNGSLVMEIDFKLDEKFQDKEFNIKIEDVNVFIPSRNSSWGELIISERDSVQKMEDGTYKMFKYLALEDPVTAGTGIWVDSFYEDEVVNCTVEFGNLTDKDGNLLIKDKNNDWKFEFELKKPDNLNEDIEIPDQVIEKIQYKDVEINVNSIKNSTFGNIITINAVQKNIDINKINDIQKIDFIVKDLNGNKINVISRTQNITMGDYKNGSMTLVCLEDIYLTIDDTTENAEYKIEIIEATKPVISIEKIQGINEELLKDFKNGNSVLSIDGGQQLRETLDKKGLDYYIDEYGVYRIDKTNDEIYGENIVDSQEKNEIENPININNGEKMLTSSELASNSSRA